MPKWIRNDKWAFPEKAQRLSFFKKIYKQPPSPTLPQIWVAYLCNLCQGPSEDLQELWPRLGRPWFSTSLQFVASLKSSCCLWSELFWANEYQRIGWDFGCRRAAANSLHRGGSAGRRLARWRISCSTSHFSLKIHKWGWRKGIIELLCVNLLLALESPWEGLTLLHQQLIFLLTPWADLGSGKAEFQVQTNLPSAQDGVACCVGFVCVRVSLLGRVESFQRSTESCKCSDVFVLPFCHLLFLVFFSFFSHPVSLFIPCNMSLLSLHFSFNLQLTWIQNHHSHSLLFPVMPEGLACVPPAPEGLSVAGRDVTPPLEINLLDTESQSLTCHLRCLNLNCLSLKLWVIHHLYLKVPWVHQFLFLPWWWGIKVIPEVPSWADLLLWDPPPVSLLGGAAPGRRAICTQPLEICWVLSQLAFSSKRAGRAGCLPGDVFLQD